jgi:chaperonin GroEL
MKVYDDSQSLRDKILEGINKLADNVASTLGPRGQNVILQGSDGQPIITKDGVTVAEFVDFEDPFENLGAQIVKQSSRQTNAVAGDGTTTATILTRAIMIEAQKYIASGYSPTEIKRGIDKAVKIVCEGLTQEAKPVESLDDIINIATISANGDKTIGELIGKAIELIGVDGSISIREGRTNDTHLEVVEGFRFDSGIVAASFATDERRGLLKYDNALVLVTDEVIDAVEDVLPALEIAARDKRPFVVVADNIEGQALAALIMNSIRGTMKVAAVKAPRYGEERRNIIKDLCASTGATLISRETGVSLREVKLEHFGTAKHVESSKFETTFIGGTGDPEVIEKKIAEISSEIENIDDINLCHTLQERLSRLAAGVAIINVGAPTEIEMIEKKHRIEDSLEAVKSAQEEGVIPGGGIALLRSSSLLKSVTFDNAEQRCGLDIVARACSHPIKQMAKNSGVSADVIIENVNNKEEHSYGYNFSTQKYEDLVECGVLDPVKVTKNALLNASSAASTLLNTKYAIVDDKS